MDTMTAFYKGEQSRGNQSKVFDWDKAAEIIKDKGIKNASAGLSGDWEYTGGEILVDGKIPDDSYTYLSSTWATPELKIDGLLVDCWKYTDDWNAGTFWPESAKEILSL